MIQNFVGQCLVEFVVELAGLAQLLLKGLAFQAPSILRTALRLIGTIALEDKAVELSLPEWSRMCQTMSQ